MSYAEELGKKAKAAEMSVANASTSAKNNALAAISKALIENSSLIVSENAKDLAARALGRIDGLVAGGTDGLRRNAL